MTEYHIDCVREYDCHREADTIGDAVAEAYDIVRCFTWEDKYEVVKVTVTDDETGDTRKLTIKAREVW